MTAAVADAVFAERTNSVPAAAKMRTARRTVPPLLGAAILACPTGASAGPQLVDLGGLTSAHVRTYVQLADVFEPGTWARGPVSSSEFLESIKERTDLTWGQIAEALGVASRSIYLWRRGGGLSAEHEERLYALDSLVTSIEIGDAADTRRELLDGAAGRSLLDGLRAGARPTDLVSEAPWRVAVLQQLEANIAALEDPDAALDEDFVFLLHYDDERIARTREEAGALLGSPRTTQRNWRDFLNLHLAATGQRAHGAERARVDVGAVEAETEPPGLTPLWAVADLGVSLGVGAIAAPAPLGRAR